MVGSSSSSIPTAPTSLHSGKPEPSSFILDFVITFAKIEGLARTFPGTVVSTSYGTPAIKVGKKLLLRMHGKEDAIVILLGSVEEQQHLIERDPMAFYITDHYEGYPAVLVRPTIEQSMFHRIFENGWRRLARKGDLASYEQSP